MSSYQWCFRVCGLGAEGVEAQAAAHVTPTLLGKVSTACGGGAASTCGAQHDRGCITLCALGKGVGQRAVARLHVLGQDATAAQPSCSTSYACP